MPRFSSSSRSKSASAGSWLRISAMSVRSLPSYFAFCGCVKLVSQLFSSLLGASSFAIRARSSGSRRAAISLSGPPSFAQNGSPIVIVVPE